MIRDENIKIMSFVILCICFIFYLFTGIFSYKKDKTSKVNIRFFILCISASFWAIGYAFMLIAPNIEIANIWRIVASLGWCFISGIEIIFILTLTNTNKKNLIPKFEPLLYIISTLFFINNLVYEPYKIISLKAYGYIDNLYGGTTIGIVSSIYATTILLSGFVIIYIEMINSPKNRIKKQMKIILITGLICLCLGSITDIILPSVGVVVFPSGIICISIYIGGFWYAINKHKIMSISYELISDYIFEAVNEPIFIVGEDLLIKNCNQASLNITGYNPKDLYENSLDKIMDFKNFDFDTIMQNGSATNIEVDLHSKNKDILVCELSATVIYDEYKDILGIVTLLHDVSERKEIAELQKKYTFELEESNINLENEITERIVAEEQIRHYVYYDNLTQLYNRKKMQEDVEILLDNRNEIFAVLFIDLDKFKSANDNYGHQAGDDILKTVALRLKNIVRSTDTIYRIGGDEFIIILRDLNKIEYIKKIAVAVLETLIKAFNFKENLLFVGASIGISIFPEHGIDADTLIKKADLAMYEAKSKGGNIYKLYS